MTGFTLCDSLAGMQLELGEKLKVHGGVDDCDKVTVNANDFISLIKLNYSEQDGLKYVRIETAKGKSLISGKFSEDAGMETKSLSFNKDYRLIGLKSASEGQSITALGAIVFDSGCSLLNPNGPRIDNKTIETEAI